MIEVPDKIYVRIDPVWGSMYVNYDKNDPDNIDYVHFDTFIKRVIDFIELNITDYIDVSYPGGDEHIELQKEFIEDFKNNFKTL